MNEKLFKPTHLKELCAKYGLQPSKKYGQNYLISESPIQKMIMAGELKKDDIVVEVGPGFGVLTFALSPLVKKVLAFEIEKKLSDYWAGAQPEQKNVQVIWGNALNNLQSETVKLKSYKVLANLPYQITAKVLRTLLELSNPPERIIIMVQKEVAERIIAKPPKMSLLAVSVQYYAVAKIVCQVSRGNFWPEPKVDSAVIMLTPNKSRDPQTTEYFFQVTKAGFANPRKQLWRNLSVGLKMDGVMVKDILRQATGSDLVRAEALSVAEWERVAEELEVIK